jgi:hypothetical protein
VRGREGGWRGREKTRGREGAGGSGREGGRDRLNLPWLSGEPIPGKEDSSLLRLDLSSDLPDLVEQRSATVALGQERGYLLPK